MEKIKKTFSKSSNLNKGITLVALVITIVILIILATVSIGAVFGDNGLIMRAQEAGNEHSKAYAKEQIEIALADIAVTKYDPNTEYSDEKLDDLIYERLPESDVDGEEISYGGHTFELDRSVPKIGKWIGESGNLPARIRKIVVTEDSVQKQVSVQVETVRTEKVESPKYKYYIKVERKENSSYVEKANIVENTYTFTELENNRYVIKVELISESTSKVIDYKEIMVTFEKFSNIYQTTTEYTDSEGNKAWIPGGFAVGVSEGINKINDGLVITDAIDVNYNSTGNQFVWIPVNDASLENMYEVAEAKLNGVETTTSVYSKLRVRSGEYYTPTIPGNTTGIREPDVLSSYDTDEKYYKDILEYNSTKEMADAMVSEYKATYESIKKYDGFYIGRFELTGSLETPTVKRGQEVLSNQNWYNLKKACTNVISSTYAQSTMVYGNQWDEIMSWLIATGEKNDSEVNTDSSSWGSYNAGATLSSGYYEEYKANNIYDLAAYHEEFTQEADYTSYRGTRGGNSAVSDNHYPASSRMPTSYPQNSDRLCTSRPSLYIR